MSKPAFPRRWRFFYRADYIPEGMSPRDDGEWIKWEDFIAYITELSAEPGAVTPQDSPLPRWIPVGERIPKMGKGNPSNTWPKHYLLSGHGGRITWDVFWGQHYEAYGIKYWLDWGVPALPAPPVGDSSKG